MKPLFFGFINIDGEEIYVRLEDIREFGVAKPFGDYKNQKISFIRTPLYLYHTHSTIEKITDVINYAADYQE